MNRFLSICASPEFVLGALSGAVFWFCARHNSGEGRDVRLVEMLVWILPLVAVPCVFATFLAPGARSWWWLARVNLVLAVGLSIDAYRIVSAFGEGAKGQDAGFIVVAALGVMLGAIGNSIVGTLILLGKKPALAEWFRLHWFTGTVLTLLSAIPVAVLMAMAAGVFLGVIGGAASFWTTLNR